MGNKIESFKMERLKHNKTESVLYEKFHDEISYDSDAINAIVFGTKDGINVADKLTEKEKRIVVGTIQWLGTPVGTQFLNQCGFIKE